MMSIKEQGYQPIFLVICQPKACWPAEEHLTTTGIDGWVAQQLSHHTWLVVLDSQSERCEAHEPRIHISACLKQQAHNLHMAMLCSRAECCLLALGSGSQLHLHCLAQAQADCELPRYTQQHLPLSVGAGGRPGHSQQWLPPHGVWTAVPGTVLLSRLCMDLLPAAELCQAGVAPASLLAVVGCPGCVCHGSRRGGQKTRQRW